MTAQRPTAATIDPTNEAATSLLPAALARLQAIEHEIGGQPPAEAADELSRRATLRAVERQVDEGELRRLSRRMALRDRLARMKPARPSMLVRVVSWMRASARARRRQRRAARKATADPPAGSGDAEPPPETTKARQKRANASTGPPKDFATQRRPFPFT